VYLERHEGHVSSVMHTKKDDDKVRWMWQ